MDKLFTEDQIAKDVHLSIMCSINIIAHNQNDPFYAGLQEIH